MIGLGDVRSVREVNSASREWKTGLYGDRTSVRVNSCQKQPPSSPEFRLPRSCFPPPRPYWGEVDRVPSGVLVSPSSSWMERSPGRYNSDHVLQMGPRPLSVFNTSAWPNFRAHNIQNICSLGASEMAYQMESKEDTGTGKPAQHQSRVHFIHRVNQPPQFWRGAIPHQRHQNSHGEIQSHLLTFINQ